MGNMEFAYWLFAPIDPGGGNINGTITGLLIYIVIALGVSFLCSILEAVILSVSISHIEILVQKGEKAGLLMQKLKSNIENPISAVLTLNTIAHTVGAAGAGAQAAALFGSQFIGVVSAILTFLILVFSEIIPKTLGAVYWKQLTPFTAYTLNAMVFLLYPAVWFFKIITRKLHPDKVMPTITRMDLQALARLSTAEGVLLEQENRVFRNLLRLQEIHISTILTPRTIVSALPENKKVKEVLEQIGDIPYSRLPIYRKSLDDANFYVLKSELLDNAARGEMDKPLKDLGRYLHAIPESVSVAKALDEFITRKEQIALVIDEYGGTAGLLTMEDVLESLLGIEITDETDLVADLQQLARVRFERKQKQLKSES
jgi:CBS domain containing-hemolysin-like protein